MTTHLFAAVVKYAIATGGARGLAIDDITAAHMISGGEGVGAAAFLPDAR